MNTKTELTINASISKVWEVMGNQFADVHKWSTNFQNSEGGGKSKFDGIGVAYRKTITERGVTIQELDDFNASEFYLEYHITEGAPEIAKRAASKWALEKIDEETTKVILHFILEPKVTLNEEMEMKMKKGLEMSAMQIAEELKYFVEQGQPHPNKVKQQASA